MAAPAEDPQVHGQGPGRVSLSDSSGTEGEKSDSYQVFPDYSQLVPDRTAKACGPYGLYPVAISFRR